MIIVLHGHVSTNWSSHARHIDVVGVHGRGWASRDDLPFVDAGRLEPNCRNDSIPSKSQLIRWSGDTTFARIWGGNRCAKDFRN